MTDAEGWNMTELVTVRRDALRQFIYDELREQEWGVDSAEKEANIRFAAMLVSPWREIDDEARNGQLWLISGFVEDNPEKGRWVVIGRWWPEHGYWTSEEDEPEGWEPEFYPPTLYAPIPELPK